MSHRLAFGTAALATLAAIVLLFMVGCANPNLTPEEQAEQRVYQTWVSSCEGYKGAIQSLYGFYQAGRLSEADLKAIRDWRRKIDPLCTADAPPTDGSLLDMIDRALQELLLLERDKA